MSETETIGEEGRREGGEGRRRRRRI